MDFRRVRPWDWLTGALGAVLLVSLFLDWYETPAGVLDGWNAFAVTDLVLALTGLAALALVALAAARRAPALPVAAGVVAATLAVPAFLLTVIRHLNEPGGNDEVSIAAGAYVGLLAGLGLVLASWRSMRDESAPGIPDVHPVEVLEPPPAQAAS